ncbi:MAG TPA: Ku protein [Steroidobacteraceae bacterium]|nr:Ku protein [Steroidobacteraceae bacterium]
MTISFGLIAIPVQQFSATQYASRISFNMLHKDCGTRVKQQYICPVHERVVERDEIVKGYEFEKGRYVQFTPEEIKAFDEVGTHSIEISEFVSIEAVDPVYYENAYYLAPDKGGARPYSLLVQALNETKRCAIARWAARGNSNLVMLRPVGKVLVMQQLHFSNEVKPVSEIEVPAQEIKPAELNLAKQLIEQQASDEFEPTAYVDEVRARVEAAIQQKIKGEKITISEDSGRKESGNIIDIMEALRASLKKTETAKTSVGKLGNRKPAKRIETPAKTAKKAGRQR